MYATLLHHPFLFKGKTTQAEEVAAIYDDYCGDMYAIKNNDNHETCHHA